MSKKGGSEENTVPKWQCAICQGRLEQPKLLPCSHSFCQGCLASLIQHSHNPTSIRCPTCRESARVPARGASGFKNNIYLQEEKEEKKPESDMCRLHKKPRELDLYCFDCRVLICMECKAVGDHQNHKTFSLDDPEANQHAKTLINQIAIMAEVSASNMAEERKGYQQEFDKFNSNYISIRKEIINRHKIMSDTANFCRDEALSILDSNSTKSAIEQIVKQMTEVIGKLTTLSQKADKASSESAGTKDINLFQALCEIQRQEENLERKMHSIKEMRVNERKLCYFVTPSPDTEALSQMKGLMGHAEMRKMKRIEVFCKSVQKHGTSETRSTDLQIGSQTPDPLGHGDFVENCCNWFNIKK